MKRLFSISFVLFWSVAVVAAQSDLQPLATVKLHKTESITLRQLKSRVETFEKQSGGVKTTVDQKKEILDAMVSEKLVVQAAARDGLNIPDSAVEEAFLQSISQQVGGEVTEQEFAAIVKSQYDMSLNEFFEEGLSMNLAEYKAFIKSQIIIQNYVAILKQTEIQQNSTVTDAEIRSAYEINKAQLVQNDILKLFVVIVPKGNSTEAARTLATSLHSDLKSNETTYDELRIKAQNSNSGFQAGNMYVSKGTLAAQQLGMSEEAFLDLFTQNIGFFDDLNEMTVDYRFHIVLDKYGAKMLALDDLVQPDTTVTVYEYLRNQLSQQKQQYAFALALQEVADSLLTPENYQMLKTDSVLDTLLVW